MRKYQVILYGSYGYTGRLIAQVCKAKNISVLLSGRNNEKLASQSIETGFPYQTVPIYDKIALQKLVAEGDLVIHCGGPFQFTAKQMIEACIRSKTHYTDITGEYQVFELLATYDEIAKEKGVFIMPGVGFDVVPTDCLSLHLKTQMPDATHLELAFATSTGGSSRGTSKTMTESMGYGSMIRENALLKKVNLGDDILEIDFGPFVSRALCIPWGDISTAWRSTGIPNIKVYTAVPDKMIQSAKMSKRIGWLLRKRWFKNYLIRKIDKKPDGPSDEKREKGRTYIWGKVRNAQGQEKEARLETSNGYTLTAEMSVIIAEKILEGNVSPGYFTPAQYFGEKLILESDSAVFK